MVNAALRLLPLLALTALLGAVGIGPRRETGSDRSDERTSSPAPSPEPSVQAPAASPPAVPFPEPSRRAGIGPRSQAPAPASVPSTIGPRKSVGIAPRAPEPSPGFSPSALRRDRSAAAAAGPAFSAPVRIQRREGVETEPRRNYWHGTGHERYSHYYDGRVHWYGYPFAESFFWMRPYEGLWWTWDARFSRWSYWNDGFWWWPGPAGVQYVYLDDNYYPYDAVRRAPAAPAAAAGEGRGAWTSPDGRRLVEVSGPESEAILYDKAAETPAYIKFLGKDVRKVRFSSAAPGSPPTILVEFGAGSFALYDYEGRRLDTAAPAAVKRAPPASDVPPPPPEDLPPPR
jgi:hypothetical protein